MPRPKVWDQEEYQRQYQKTAEPARQARKRYYKRNSSKWADYARKARSTPEGQLKAILGGIKNRAKTKGLEFDLTLEDIQPPEICPALGIPILFNTGRTDNSPSVDRVNSALGYVKSNIRVISNRANTLKSNATAEELEMIAKYIRESLDKNF